MARRHTLLHCNMHFKLFLICVTINVVASADICWTKAGPISDQPCTFPFTYKGVEYYKCTKIESATGEAWCSTEVDDNVHHVEGKWGYCKTGCPENEETNQKESGGCPQPYVKIGKQCLFFSQPEASWGIDEHKTKLHYNEAAEMCRAHGGDLAKEIVDKSAAGDYCKAPSVSCGSYLLRRAGFHGVKCFQWTVHDDEVERDCEDKKEAIQYVCEKDEE